MNRLLTTTLVIHHSVTPQNWDQQPTVDLILQSHIARGLAYDGHIAYHLLVGKDWTYVGRPINSVGYHAGNWLVNLSSIAICLVGNFNNDMPTPWQEQELRKYLTLYKNLSLKLHKEVRLQPTACPGDHITHPYLTSLTVNPLVLRVNEAIREAVGPVFVTPLISNWFQDRVRMGKVGSYQELVDDIRGFKNNHQYPF